MVREPSFSEPYPPQWTVREGLAVYLQENGFTQAAYDEPWTAAALFGLRFRVPNPPGHRRAIMLHDLHHVATGFGTDPAGEGEISAWEFRGGLRGLDLYVRTIVTGGLLLGLALAPWRTIRAMRTSSRRNLFALDAGEYDALLDLTIGELRERLDIAPSGLADRPRGLHWDAPRHWRREEASSPQRGL